MNNLKYRQLGKSSLKVSEIGFGAWTLGTDWWGTITGEESIRLVKRALELGMNFVDTSDSYASGASEKLVGEAIQGQREEIILSTKFGYDIHSEVKREGHQEREQKFTAEHINIAVEESLERLQTSYIDLYQLHNPKMDHIKNSAVFDALDDLVQNGKIRYYGVALGPAIGWTEEGLNAMKSTNIVSLQTVYNMVEQDPGRSFLSVAKENGVGILVRVPHASGLLDGKFNAQTTFASNDHRSYRQREWLTKGLKKIQPLDYLLNTPSRTMSQTALRFTLMDTGISSVLPTISTMNDLEEYAKASDLDDLTEEEFEKINQVYAQEFQAETLSYLMPKSRAK